MFPSVGIMECYYLLRKLMVSHWMFVGLEEVDLLSCEVGVGGGS